MSRVDQKKAVIFNPTTGSCPIGEITGKKNMCQSKIPVLSCEGACIRGEIARLAANIVSKNDSYRRGCHGELITVPESAIARWISAAEKVVLIDGCFLRCHGRVLENIIDEEKLIQFDALSHHKKYNDILDYDDVPEDERKEVAQSVADWVMDSLNNPSVGRASSCGDSNDLCSPCCGS
ncbi:MAG: putative zinc-binding protein [Desulfobacterales bacterium]